MADLSKHCGPLCTFPSENLSAESTKEAENRGSARSEKSTEPSGYFGVHAVTFMTSVQVKSAPLRPDADFATSSPSELFKHHL